MSERNLKGWDEVAELTPYSKRTLQRKYGREMKEKGWIIKSNLGRLLKRK